MKNFSLTQKIAFGFAALVLLSAALATLAVLKMKKAGVSADQLAHEFVPESEVAGNIDQARSRTMLAIRSYGFTAEPHYLTEARQSLAETEKTIQQARTLAVDLGDPLAIARTEFFQSFCAGSRGHGDAAYTFAQEALATFRAKNDQQWLPFTLNRLGIETHGKGDWAGAEALYQEALDRWGEFEEEFWLEAGRASHNLLHFDVE